MAQKSDLQLGRVAALHVAGLRAAVFALLPLEGVGSCADVVPIDDDTAPLPLFWLVLPYGVTVTFRIDFAVLPLIGFDSPIDLTARSSPILAAARGSLPAAPCG